MSKTIWQHVKQKTKDPGPAVELDTSHECAKKPKNTNFRGSARKAKTGRMRRVNLIEQQANQSEGSTDDDAENAVLHVNGDGTPAIVSKGKINNQPFCTMIDSGSPITIFTLGHLRKILNSDVIFARSMPKSEEYVDYNG